MSANPRRCVVRVQSSESGAKPVRVRGNSRTDGAAGAGRQPVRHLAAGLVAATERLSDLVFWRREQVHAPRFALITGRGESGGGLPVGKRLGLRRAGAE